MNRMKIMVEMTAGGMKEYRAQDFAIDVQGKLLLYGAYEGYPEWDHPLGYMVFNKDAWKTFFVEEGRHKPDPPQA